MASVSVDIAQTLNITCRRGDTFVLDVTITNSSGAALDVSGYGGVLLVKSQDGATAILDFYTNIITNPTNRTVDDTYNASTDGLITMAHGGGSNNVIRFSCSAAIMAALTPGTYSYDFAVQYDASNIITTYLKGAFIVNADI